VAAVQLAHPLTPHQLQRQVAVLDPGRPQRSGGRPAQPLGRVDQLELDQDCWRRAARSPGACFSAYSL
jgi:hypothetical protein